MSKSRIHGALNRRGLLGAVLIAALAGPTLALAHHGWSWADAEQIELKGTIQKISMAPPHPTLMVKADDGAVWLVELANPNQTERSGFRASSAKPGDAITVLGNRDQDKTKTHMKAVRITIGGKNYDLYPERIGGR
jgi:hypothetical protein